MVEIQTVIRHFISSELINQADFPCEGSAEKTKKISNLFALYKQIPDIFRYGIDDFVFFEFRENL